MSFHSRPDRLPPVTISRPSRGRWLGGVCAGLAPIRGVNVLWVRLAFVVGALLGGLGIALYIAAWLIIPAEGAEAHGANGLVVLARAIGACVALAMLGALGATATVFGFGWVVAGLAAAILLGVLAGWRRLGPGWALLPVAALTLPAVAVATAGVQLVPRAGQSVVAPRTVAALQSTTYRSGLDTLLIDLRRTPLPPDGTVPLRIQAGVRRTIVALPENRCVHVVVHYEVHPFMAQLAAQLSRRTAVIFSDLVLFGQIYATGSPGTVQSSGGLPGPVLTIDFTSQGGSLYVRDYPNAVHPDLHPLWPGFPVTPEPRPNKASEQGLKRRGIQALLRNWRARLAVDLSQEHTINQLLPGPCVAALPSPASTRRAPAHHGRAHRSASSTHKPK